MKAKGFGTIEIAGVIVIAMMGLALWIQTARVENCKVEREALTTANLELKAAVEKQNAAVDRLLNEAEDRKAKGAQALAQAQARRRQAEAELRRLQGVRLTGLTCAQAVKAVKDGLRAGP